MENNTFGRVFRHRFLISFLCFALLLGVSCASTPLSLAAGDTGIRSVQTVQQTTVPTGWTVDWRAVLFHVICPLPTEESLFDNPLEWDTFRMGLPRIHKDAALAFWTPGYESLPGYVTLDFVEV